MTPQPPPDEMNPPPDAPMLPPSKPEDAGQWRYTLPGLGPIPAEVIWDKRGFTAVKVDEVRQIPIHMIDAAKWERIEAVKDSPAATVAGTPQLGRPAFLGPPAHDWPEDFLHENGKYFVPCKACGVQFMGHKRRPLCKVCAEPPVADSLGDTPRTDAEIERINDSTEDYAWRDMCNFARALERELAEAKPWMLAFRDNMTLGEISEICGCSLYSLTQPFTKATIRITKPDTDEIWRLRADLTAAKQDSERLEWLIQRIVQSAGHPAWTRESIDAARREEGS